MPLKIVATPIGNPDDITSRAKQAIKDCDILIGEEKKETTRLLKSLGIQKPIELLNEHSDQEDIKFLIGLCRDKNVALVTDAGTPSFQDPGFQLVKICREQKIPVTSLPGPASLTCLLSMASERINSFYFAGFLPTDKTDRQLQFKELSKMKGSIILMDTPYRLERTLEEIAHLMPGRKILLGGDMTLESEFYFEGRAKDLISLVKDRKAPFVVLIY